MSFFCEQVLDQVKGVLVTHDPMELIKFHNEDCAAAIWHRRLKPEFLQWLEQIPVEQLPHGRLTTDIAGVAQGIEDLCDQTGLEPCALRDLWVNDVTSMADLFASLMDVSKISFRLEKVSDNACRKFHRDALEARLVCTYRGPGTQYGVSHNNEVPKTIVTTPTGAPILLRGQCWPEEPPSGVLHRSPPIQAHSQTRLLLVVDTAAEY